MLIEGRKVRLSVEGPSQPWVYGKYEQLRLHLQGAGLRYWSLRDLFLLVPLVLSWSLIYFLYRCLFLLVKLGQFSVMDFAAAAVLLLLFGGVSVFYFKWRNQPHAKIVLHEGGAAPTFSKQDIFSIISAVIAALSMIFTAMQVFK